MPFQRKSISDRKSTRALGAQWAEAAAWKAETFTNNAVVKDAGDETCVCVCVGRVRADPRGARQVFNVSGF